MELAVTVNSLVLQQSIGLMYQPLVTDTYGALVDLGFPEEIEVFSCSPTSHIKYLGKKPGLS
jgi:hypothetical protein